MNKWQRRVILGGLAILILMGLFPPWLHSFEIIYDHSVMRYNHSAGYSFLFSPPFPGDNTNNFKEFVREMVQGQVRSLWVDKSADYEYGIFAGAVWTPLIDMDRLLIQCLIVIFIVAGGFLILKDKAEN